MIGNWRLQIVDWRSIYFFAKQYSALNCKIKNNFTLRSKKRALRNRFNIQIHGLTFYTYIPFSQILILIH